MNYEELKRNIADVVKPNGNQEITGQIMQDALFALIENLGEGWQFGGAVRPSDAPVLGADVRGFWLAVEKGVYTDFGGVEVTELSAIVYGDGWGVLPLGVAFGVDTEAEIGALSERVKALEADGSVTTSRIADGAVTTPKIASGAITNDNIRAGAVSADKLNTDLQAKVNDNVKIVEQTLTAEQKAQARKNIGALSSEDGLFGYNEPLAQVINVNTSGDSATYVHQTSYETKTFRVKKGLAYMIYLQAASDLYLRLTYSESLPSDGIGYDFIKELVPSSDYRVEYYTPNQDGYYSITYYKGDMNVICYSFDPIIIGAEQQMTSYITNELSTLNTYPAEYKQGSIYQGVPDDSINNCIYNPNYFYNSGKPIILRNTKATDGKYWKVRIALYDKNKKWVRDAQNYLFKDGDTKLQFAEPYFQYAISLYSADGEGLNCTPEDYSTNLIQFIGNGLRLGVLENDIKNLRDEQQETYPIKLTKLLDFAIEKAIDVTSGYGDAVCFDGNVFQFIDGNEFCYIHDAESGRLVQTLTMPNPNTAYHNNCVTLGGKYNESDEFPLIYASQEAPRKCIVYRVSKTEGQYSLSVVQEILFSTSLGTYLVYRNCLIDAYEGKLVMCGLKNTPWSGTDKNTLQYIVFNLPNPTTPQVQLTESDIVFRSKVYENFPTPQGGEMRFGMLYQVFGVNSPQKLMVWEMERDQFVKEINLTEELANSEPEGLYIYKDEIHIVYKGGSVYGISKGKGVVQSDKLSSVLQEIDLTGTDADRKAKLDQFETDWKALTGASDLTGARFVGQITTPKGGFASVLFTYNADIDTFTGVTNLDDGDYRNHYSVYLNGIGELTITPLFSHLEAITIKIGNTPEAKAANAAAIKAYVDNLKALGVDVTKGYYIPFVRNSSNAHGILIGSGENPRLQGLEVYNSSDCITEAIFINSDGTLNEKSIQLQLDARLETKAKSVIKAINEVNALAKGYSTIFTPIELTTDPAQNKTAIDARVAAFTAQGISLTNGCCIPVTYKGVYAGNISLINGDWYGLLVKNTNNPADNINIKLSADGTITEGNSAQ